MSAETCDGLSAMGVDFDDPERLDNAARWLRRLGNDKQFLGDVLVAELAQRHREDVLDSSYGPQVVILAPPNGNFFIRANIWPSTDEHMLRASGGTSFVYGLPHDHKYDYEAVTGFTGEEVPSLRFVERSRLEEGKLMLYRAHRDVHAQHPADALSVSLNIMHTTGAQGWLDQYRFDLDQRRIGAIVSGGPSEAFMRIAVGLGGAEALDLAHRFAHCHPSDRMRLACWDALAAVATAQERDGLWSAAEQAGSRLVAAEARRRRAELAASGKRT